MSGKLGNQRDQELLDDDSYKRKGTAKRNKLHNETMTFFHRTQYISSEFSRNKQIPNQDNTLSSHIMEGVEKGGLKVRECHMKRFSLFLIAVYHFFIFFFGVIATYGGFLCPKKKIISITHICMGTHA